MGIGDPSRPMFEELILPESGLVERQWVEELS